MRDQRPSGLDRRDRLGARRPICYGRRACLAVSAEDRRGECNRIPGAHRIGEGGEVDRCLTGRSGAPPTENRLSPPEHNHDERCRAGKDGGESKANRRFGG